MRLSKRPTKAEVVELPFVQLLLLILNYHPSLGRRELTKFVALEIKRAFSVPDTAGPVGSQHSDYNQVVSSSVNKSAGVGSAVF